MSAVIPATHEARSVPTFRERVHALAGHGTWREPSGGHSSEAKQIPTDHLIAAALSFGRRNPRDIGPDIAADIATGRPANYLRVCEWAGRRLVGDRDTRAVRRNRAHLGHATMAAYNAMVRGYSVPLPPDGVTEDDWAQLVLGVCLMLEHEAEDALALAARRYRRAA